MKTLLLVSLLLGAASARGMAACDPTTISGAPYYTDADSALVQDPFRSYAHSTEGYDFHVGRFFGYCSACFEVANVQGSDTYRIQGAPAGVPIPIHVEFHVVIDHGGNASECGVGCNQNHISASASIDTAQGAVPQSYCVCGGVTKSIGLDLIVMPDQDFVIYYFLSEYVGTDGFAAPGQIEGTIHFSGLPGGAQLVSCHGVNDGAVAALPSTWGGLKARYR